MIINGSPRAPHSNSKYYADIFSDNCILDVDYFILTRNNQLELCSKVGEYQDLLFVFPLYADAIPVGMLNFLKLLEVNSPKKKPVVSILINCGFLEHEQNKIAVSMIQLFCKQNQYKLGSVLMLGSGEAILKTPFRYVACKAIREFANSIGNRDYRNISATMPLPKRLFQWAATIYWTRYGKKYGQTKEKMQTMQIG